MLAALLLIGLVPFAMVPLMSEDDAEAEAGGPDDLVSLEAETEDNGSLLSDDFTGQDEVIDEEVIDDGDDGFSGETDSSASDGQTFTLTGQPGTVEIEDFQPGEDRLEIDLTGQTEEVVVDIEHGNGMSTLTLGLSSGTMMVDFEGLDEVPQSDIHFTSTDAETGETQSISLTELLEAWGQGDGATGDTGTEAVTSATDDATLDPSDADAADDPADTAHATGTDPTDPDDDDGTGLAGLDPVDPDEPGEGTPGDGEAGIDPVDPDETGSGTPGNGEPGLDPVDPDAEYSGDGSLDPVDPDAADAADQGLDPADAAGDQAQGMAPTDPDDPDSSQTNAEAADLLSAALQDEGAEPDGIDAVIAAFEQSGGEATEGTGGDDAIALADDGASGTGEGTLAMQDGAAVVTSDAPVDVVAGNGGDDTLTGGDAAAYLFGGAGDDDLTAAEGASALYGGDGADTIDAASSDNAAYLDGGAGNDTLIMDGADTASGGEGEDTFWLYANSNGGTVAEITDFTSGTDFLRISLNPNSATGDTPAVEVVPTGDGSDSAVQVNGQTVAVLRGATDVTAEDVFVELRAEVFA